MNLYTYKKNSSNMHFTEIFVNLAVQIQEGEFQRIEI